MFFKVVAVALPLKAMSVVPGIGSSANQALKNIRTFLLENILMPASTGDKKLAKVPDKLHFSSKLSRRDDLFLGQDAKVLRQLGVSISTQQNSDTITISLSFELGGNADDSDYAPARVVML